MPRLGIWDRNASIRFRDIFGVGVGDPLDLIEISYGFIEIIFYGFI